MTPKISFIISAFDRPIELEICLLSLICQTEQNWETIVTDNANSSLMRQWHEGLIQRLCDPRIHYTYTGDHARHCYYSAEIGWKMAKGEWLSFPCDDTYYTPRFIEKMLRAGETGECDRPTQSPLGPLDWVCCDFVWGRLGTWTYCDGGPQVCHVNKASFIIRRSEMIPFPQKDDIPNPPCEGLLAEELVARGKRMGRIVEVLCVHN